MDEILKKIKPRRLFGGFKARYNVASWQSKGGHVFVIFRQIKKRGGIDQPDITKLILSEFDEQMNPIHERVAWEPKNRNLLLEDPRAFLLPDGSVVLGLTSLLKDRENTYIPYPALINLNTNEWRETLPAITIVESFGPGKNMTPVEKDVFFFRPDGDKFSHTLLVFSFKNQIPKKEQLLRFPKNLPWATYKIGTAMPPLWLDENRAIMIFHGIKFENGRYIYSLGRAGLIKERGKYKVRVNEIPIMDPDFFRDSDGKQMAKELHPKLRRVIYCCGGVLKPTDEKTLILFVNVGDSSTFEVDIPISELSKNLF